ncbi:MAG: serine/threonine protein kinase, partial [Gemmataceae bacterium]|nr:serine/threonine protein kinase [Gemmataceae bacterium]
MPPPATIPELTDRLKKSGLVPPERLAGFLAGLAASGHRPDTPAALLDRLADAGMITRFHAGKLAAGKYKGFHLGRYLILDQIGSGGMGQVFLAEHAAMRRLVAVKVLSVAATDDPVARERFVREARAAGTLDHPNVVRVFDLCQDGRLLYLVMEYVDGVSLQAMASRGGPLPVGAAVHYARQVLFGLQHAHEQGFVHRDIKPANLLVDRSGVVKILDLGLVRSDADGPDGITKLLDNKTVLGTADYVAPEQAVDSSAVDHRADLYSLGATLYFLLTGQPLFPDGRAAQKLIWQQTREPVRVDAVRPEVPAGLARVVHTLLAKRPDDRYASAAEAFDALAAW